MEIREINTAEFIKLIDNYFQDATVTDLTLLQEWMNDQIWSPHERHRFYYYVIQSHKYKKMPTLAYFVEYLKQFRPDSYAGRDDSISEHNRQEILRWKSFSDESIIRILIEINKKPIESIRIGDISFLNKYGAMYSEMRYLQERGESREYIRIRLKKFRESIDNDVRIKYSEGNNKIDESQIVKFEDVR